MSDDKEEKSSEGGVAEALALTAINAVGTQPRETWFEPDHPEAALITRLVAGEDGAYGELFKSHSGDVFRLARRFVYSDDDAQEITQEVFIAAFRHIGRFQGKSRLRTWLYRITVNRALKRKRWWHRRREVGPEPLRTLSHGAATPEGRTRDREALAIIQSCLDKLEARKREVLCLHELEGLDTLQIAEILDCPRSTVLTRLARARTELIKTANKRGVKLEER